MRALLLTLTTCLFVLPANAKYSGGTGEPNDPYQIATATDLIALGETPADYDKHFILTADIDLDPNLPGGKVFDRAVIAPDTDSAQSGFQGTYFTGIFDGRGHTISHLTMKGNDYLGLFGELDGGVRDLGDVDVNITGSGDDVGGLLGYNAGTVTQCYSTGAVSGDSRVGGLAGWTGETGWGDLIQCHSSGVVEGNHAVGGLVGGNQGTVTQCDSTATVRGRNDSVGGLVGWNLWGVVTRCRSDGSVDGNDGVGGLVGKTEAGEIRDCYSMGDVSGRDKVGGLVGASCTGRFCGSTMPPVPCWYYPPSISRCYSTGAAIGQNNIGGLVGSNEPLMGVQGQILGCFWDTRTSGVAESAGGTGKTTAEMQTAKTFLDAGWDFVGETANGTEDIWWIDEGKDYPHLWWELPGNVKKALPGETMIVYVHSPENGDIAVRVQLPQSPRYPEGAPVVVVASTWFVSKYTPRYVVFDLKYDPTEVGAVFVTYLWPGKEDRETGAASEGTYDCGGPNSIAALRDVILFAAGALPDTRGYYIGELMELKPLTDNVGLYASSHAGVVATNVLAYHADDLSCVKYFVGRESPTRDEMYPLEIGHFDDQRKPVFNPYYDPAGFTPTSVSIDFSKLGWIQNETYPQGMPFFDVPDGNDYVLSGDGPEMDGKRYFSMALTRALLDNGVFTLETWPQDLATPEQVDEFWPYRITVNNYPLLKDYLPNLKVMLVFAKDDHVLSAPDKPHIHQAYRGFHNTAGLWVRLNADEAYFLALDKTLTDYPEHKANTEPADWTNARQWGYPAGCGSWLYSHTGSLAGIAEMADRAQANNWSDDLDHVLYEYATSAGSTSP